MFFVVRWRISVQCFSKLLNNCHAMLSNGSKSAITLLILIQNGCFSLCQMQLIKLFDSLFEQSFYL